MEPNPNDPAYDVYKSKLPPFGWLTDYRPPELADDSISDPISEDKFLCGWADLPECVRHSCLRLHIEFDIVQCRLVSTVGYAQVVTSDTRVFEWDIPRHKDCRLRRRPTAWSPKPEALSTDSGMISSVESNATLPKEYS